MKFLNDSAIFAWAAPSKWNDLVLYLVFVNDVNSSDP